MKLLVDMNLSTRWLEPLTAAGFTALHWSDHGAANALDAEIMIFARENGFIILTHDLDFSAILAATQGLKPSVIQIRAERPLPELIATRVISPIIEMRTELEEGPLLTIEPDRARIRMLPLL